MNLLDKFLSKKTPTKDEFATLLKKRLKQKGVEHAVYDSANFALKLGPGNTLFLGNGYSDYCQTERKDRETILSRFSSVGTPAPDIPADFQSVRPYLMPVIRDAAAEL